MSTNFFVERRDAALSVSRVESLDFIPHLHSQIEMVYSLCGEGAMTIEGESHTLRPGEAALCWPNHVHSYATLPGGNSRYYMAIFDTSLLGRTGEIFARTDCAMPFLAPDKVHPDVPLALERMAAEPDMPAPLMRAYATVATGRLLETLATTPRERADPDALHRVLAYIEANLSGDISLESMARALFLNKYYISKLFSERIGCNLHAYLNALRINRAQGLLSDPSVTLDDVMARCGYASERTFYRAFRERTGLTPRQFREGNSV